MAWHLTVVKPLYESTLAWYSGRYVFMRICVSEIMAGECVIQFTHRDVVAGAAKLN